jgi:L-fuculose-phosphate aldolase
LFFYSLLENCSQKEEFNRDIDKINYSRFSRLLHGAFIGGCVVEGLNEVSAKKCVVDISHRCGKQGWCPGTLGNISLFSSESNRVYIKRTGADLNKLALKDIIILDLEGKVLDGKGTPSKEVGFHLNIYKTRREVRSIFHVHPSYATAYAVVGKKLPMVTEAAKIVLVDVPLVDCAPPGSAELASSVVEGFRDPNVKAVLIREHGVVAVGDSLESAFHVASLVEDSAKVAFLSSLIRK